jgi:lambda family phage portal protein
MFHLYVLALAAERGEPWLHAVARRLNDMDGYSEAEITAARGAASYMATIESPEDPHVGQRRTRQAQFEIEPGVVQELTPGQKLNFVAPNRPNPNMDPFMRMMLREVAAGIGVSYESLSRDYSQSNYSSSRLALLDDRDLWKVMQQWFIRSFREPLHREWMQQAVLWPGSAGRERSRYVLLNPAKFKAVAFRPRGWSWIDPTKEVDAYIKAVVRASCRRRRSSHSRAAASISRTCGTRCSPRTPIKSRGQGKAWLLMDAAPAAGDTSGDAPPGAPPERVLKLHQTRSQAGFSLGDQ